MSQKAITRLDLVEGGTEIRQGHHFKLSFSPRDAGGNVVDLTGKKLDVVIVAKQGIVYETTATYNTAEKTVEFSVNENIGHGDMWIEITATDPNNASYRQKFPTAEHEGRLRFVRGTDDIAFVGFSGKTIAEFKAEQTAFQVEIDEKFERAAAALTEDSEVVLARDGEASLNVKLTKDKQAFTAQLAKTINKNDTGILDLNIFDEPTRAAIQGLAEGQINAVLGVGNVTPVNTTFFDYVIPKNLFNTGWIQGKIDGATGVETENVSYLKTVKHLPVDPITSYVLTFTGTQPDIFFYIHYYDTTKTYLSSGSGTTNVKINFTTPQNTRYIKVGIWRNNVAIGVDLTPTSGQLEKGTIPTEYVSPVPIPIIKKNLIGSAELMKGLNFLPTDSNEPLPSPLLKPNKNIFIEGWESGKINNDGSLGASGESVRSVNFMTVLPNTQYVSSFTGLVGDPVKYATFYDSQKLFLGYKIYTRAFVTLPNTKYVKLSFYKAGGSLATLTPLTTQVEKGGSSTDYTVKGVVVNPVYLQEPIKKEFNKIQKPNPFIRSIAHRGLNYTAPELTEPAYIDAKEKGFLYVENDLQFSSDGVPVMWHDLDITNKAYLNGQLVTEYLLVKDLTLAQLKSYDFGLRKSPEYEGTKMMTYEEYLLLCKRLSLYPYVDIKTALTQEQAGLLIDIAKKMGVLKHVTWLGNSSNLDIIRTFDNKARIGLLYTRKEDVNITSVVNRFTNGNNAFVSIEVSQIDKALSDLCSLNNVELEAWIVNDVATLSRLTELNVSGISTDHIMLDVEIERIATKS